MYRFVRTVNIDGHLLEIDETGHYFKDASTGKAYPIYVNNHRNSRETIQIGRRMFYTSRIIAKAYPEICGVWFDGCEVHHIDRNKSNNTPYNLMVISKEDHQKEHNDELIELTQKINSKPVHQYTLNGEYVATFPSSIAASDYLFPNDEKVKWHRSSIRNCLCGRAKSAFGYMWIHSDNPPLFIDPIKPNKCHLKRVSNGEKIFNSVKEAAEYYDVGMTAISNCLNGRSSMSCGFKWWYLD